MTSPEAFQSVLLRLLQSLGDDKRSVDVWQKEPPLKGRINWQFMADVNDMGKIVGKGGVRLRALRLITELAGNQSMEVWWLDQPDDPPGERRSGRRDAEIPESHDCTPDFELLRELLLCLGVSATLGVSGDVNRGFIYLVVPDRIQDNSAILEPVPALYSQSQKNVEPLNLISAIGECWRAIGANQGVKYWVRTG